MNVMFRYSEITYSLSVKREELQIFITKNIKEAVMVWRGINACFSKARHYAKKQSSAINSQICKKKSLNHPIYFSF